MRLNKLGRNSSLAYLATFIVQIRNLKADSPSELTEQGVKPQLEYLSSNIKSSVHSGTFYSLLTYSFFLEDSYPLEDQN